MKYKSVKDKSLPVAIIILLFYLAIIILPITGEIKCIVKAVRCNWEPIGKAEIVYTGSAILGLGAIVGWFNIEDN